MKISTIILDRDGVINQLGERYVLNKKEFNFIPKAIDAINILFSSGYDVVVASNQSAVGQGLMTTEDLRDIDRHINAHLNREIEFFYCLHKEADNCDCRKPKNELLEKIKVKYEGPFLFVGDNITDYYAALASNLDFALVTTGHGKRYSKDLQNAVPIYHDLYELTMKTLRKPLL